jgi:hypothetical protein
MSDASTPLMRQYNSVKQQVPNALLMFRLGDFYELFFEDAVTAARELEITLTARNKEKGTAIPMCGVPYHAAEGYIARLVQKGYRVAICDQMEDPKLAKKLARREITRVVTPDAGNLRTIARRMPTAPKDLGDDAYPRFSRAEPARNDHWAITRSLGRLTFGGRRGYDLSWHSQTGRSLRPNGIQNLVGQGRDQLFPLAAQCRQRRRIRIGQHRLSGSNGRRRRANLQ